MAGPTAPTGTDLPATGSPTDPAARPEEPIASRPADSTGVPDIAPGFDPAKAAANRADDVPEPLAPAGESATEFGRGPASETTAPDTAAPGFDPAAHDTTASAPDAQAVERRPGDGDPAETAPGTGNPASSTPAGPDAPIARPEEPIASRPADSTGVPDITPGFDPDAEPTVSESSESASSTTSPAAEPEGEPEDAPNDDELMVVDHSPAGVLRSAVAVVPGVVAVGEPASRAMGRLRSAIGLTDEAGVSLTEGSEQIAVDLSIVGSLSRPLRETAAAVQAAALASLSSTDRVVVEVNVDVLDAEAGHGDVGVAPAPPGADPAADPTPAAGLLDAGQPAPGHIRVSSRALRSAAAHVASEIFEVPEAKIGVSFSDEASDLALHLVLPLPIEPLGQGGGGGRSLRDRAIGDRAPLRERFAQLTGTSLSRVDVRVTGGLTTSGAA